MKHKKSPFIKAVYIDNSIPIEKEAVDLWLRDLDNPFRWTIRPVLQFFFAILLHLTWFLKRLPFPQFSAHNTLQKTICWFSKNFVSYEANMLILRHYSTESNILNFLIENTSDKKLEAVRLYPTKPDEMLEQSFVDHDQELFRVFSELGEWKERTATEQDSVSWKGWQGIDMQAFSVKPKITQVFDFESAHALFMCLFCLLLTRDEYRDAINGFNLDQSIAIRIGHFMQDPSLPEMAYNKYPLYLVGPWNLGKRFLMHGFFTEYLYAYLEKKRQESLSLK